MIMAGSVVPGLHVDVNIYHDHMRLLAFYNGPMSSCQQHRGPIGTACTAQCKQQLYTDCEVYNYFKPQCAACLTSGWLPCVAGRPQSSPSAVSLWILKRGGHLKMLAGGKRFIALINARYIKENYSYYGLRNFIAQLDRVARVTVVQFAPAVCVMSAYTDQYYPGYSIIFIPLACALKRPD